MKLLALILWIVSISPCLASATPLSGQIVGLNASKSLAIVKLDSEKAAAGDELTAKGKSGARCALVVRSVKGKVASMDTSACPFAKELKVGQTLQHNRKEQRATTREARRSSQSPEIMTERPLSRSSGVGSSQLLAKALEVPNAGETFGVTLFALYDTADKLKGDVNGGGESINSTENSEAAFGIGAEYAMYNYHFLGFYGNGLYEFGRDWKSADARGKTTNNEPAPTLTLFVLGAGGNFSITENVYVKAGANYNLPTLTRGAGISDINGKLGYEGGVGLRFFRNFNAEILYRKLNFSASGNSNGVAFNVDNLSTSGVIVRGGYLF